MSGRGGERQLQTEGQGLDIPAKLKMPATEAVERIGKARRTVDAFTSRFVRKDFPERLGEAARRDFDEGISVEKLAGSLGIKLRGDRREKSGASRKILFGEIGETPVVLSTSVYSDRPGYPDREGRIEVWARAAAEGIPEVKRAIWPILGYGNIGEQTYLIEPEVPREQFLMWGGPDSMREIARDRKRHPEAMRAFFSCFTQAVQFLEAVETPAKGGTYLMPRDFAKLGGNASWETWGQAGEGRLRIRDLGLWQVASVKTPDREIITKAYQWTAINQFLASNIGLVFGTDLEFSEPGRGTKVNYTSSRFRGRKSYLNSISRAFGGETDILGFVEEWNGKVSPLIQKITSGQGSVGAGDEVLPTVPGYSGMVYTGSPIELIERVLKNHGLWIPAGAKTAPAPARKEGMVVVLPVAKEPKKGLKKRQSGLRREGEGEIILGQEGKMAGTAVETLETGQFAKASAEAPRTVGEKAELPVFLKSRYELPPGYENSKGKPNFYIRVEEGGTICYFGPHAVRFLAFPEGKIFFKPVKYELPAADSNVRLEQNELGIEITDGEYPTTDVLMELSSSVVPSADSIQCRLHQGYSAGRPSNDNVYFSFPEEKESDLNGGAPSIIYMEDVSKDFGKFEKSKVVHFGCENKYLNLAVPSEAKMDPLVVLAVVYKDKQALAELGARVSPLAETTAARTERKLLEIRVDKEMLIGSKDRTTMKWLAAEAKTLSDYQQTGGLPEKLRQPGKERDEFIGSIRSLREAVYHMKPDLQKKVLLAALGEEEPGMSLTEQFDRELDELLMSWGVDLLK